MPPRMILGCAECDSVLQLEMPIVWCVLLTVEESIQWSYALLHETASPANAHVRLYVDRPPRSAPVPYKG